MLVLDLVADADGGMTVVEVAAATGVHANTAREHLDALVRSGYLARAQLPAVGRGRPAMIYRAAHEPNLAGEEYGVLAELLVAHLQRQHPDPADQAEQARIAGERWMAGGGEERRRRLFGPLFDPEVVHPAASGGEAPGADRAASEDTRAVRMRRCPVLDLARACPGVVCSIHLGLLQGALPPEVRGQVELRPFAEAGACVVRLPAGGRYIPVPGAVA